MGGISYLKGDASCPQAKGTKLICHVCNDIGGCGLTGGDWPRVEPIVAEQLGERGVSVTVYDFE
jgi:hypothetical protein